MPQCDATEAAAPRSVKPNPTTPSIGKSPHTASQTLGFGARAADEYGAIMARRRALGRPMGVLDAQIAAIAKAAGAAVATRDWAGFADSGVAVIDPYAGVEPLRPC
ncbi:MAG: hypothetical protein LBD97_06855 [Bifidobacteriaceae bacterium]|jgi:hypothetical protein|nr:hypothetical protein [Bifidobacteriaceae bacterium]